MFFNQRIIYSDNGTLSDQTINLNDFRRGSSTLQIVAAEDKLYIGTKLPWGSRFFEMGTANTNASTMSVEYYNTSSNWEDVVDLFDLTSSGGRSFGQSGYVRFQTNRDVVWNYVKDSNEILPGTKVYDLYWLRLSFSNNFSASTSVKYIGHKFSNDDALFERYPDLNQTALLEQFEAGKTTWNDQHYIASNFVVNDLTNRGIILTGDQILDPFLFEEAAVHKCAEIIYQGFGTAYQENRKEALSRYKAEMDRNYKDLDFSQDANLSVAESRYRLGYVYR